jgi:hypothetical protein
VFGERINGERQAGEISMQRRSVMKGSKARIFHAPSCWWYSTITLVGCFVFSVAVAGQNLPTGVSSSVPQLPATVGVRLKGQLSPVYEGKAGNPKQGNASPTATPRAASSEPVTTQSGVRLITLEDAQEKAAPADNPMVRLGQLQVEVARQTRLGTKSSFFLR